MGKDPNTDEQIDAREQFCTQTTNENKTGIVNKHILKTTQHTQLDLKKLLELSLFKKPKTVCLVRHLPLQQ